IQQANVRASELKTAKEFGKEVKNIDEAENKKISNIEISAYASPDGGVGLNTTLAENRQDNTAKIINRDLKKAKIDAAVDTKYTAQDWEGFQELVSKSNIQDKELIPVPGSLPSPELYTWCLLLHRFLLSSNL